MKTFITAFLVSVTLNSHGAQAPDKTSEAQVIGHRWGVHISVRNDAAENPILQVSIVQPVRYLDPNLVDSTNVAPGKPVTPEDVEVRLFGKDGNEIRVVAHNPKVLSLGIDGIGLARSDAMFTVTGADIAAVDSAEVHYAGARMIFKFREVSPRDASTQK